MTKHNTTDIFEIRLKGHLDRRWASWFEDMTITLTEEGDTVLTGPVTDQAALHGLLVFDDALLPAPAPSADVELVEPLSGRELDVLRHLAEGLSNKEIARALDISEHTVKFHVNAILGKLSAQSRTEAVVRATRAGLILL